MNRAAIRQDEHEYRGRPFVQHRDECDDENGRRAADRSRCAECRIQNTMAAISATANANAVLE
ncbi:MAG: hypothetical protein ACREX8_14625 [Gammaproteobacteria bacterium]